MRARSSGNPVVHSKNTRARRSSKAPASIAACNIGNRTMHPHANDASRAAVNADQPCVTASNAAPERPGAPATSPGPNGHRIAISNIVFKPVARTQFPSRATA